MSNDELVAWGDAAKGLQSKLAGVFSFEKINYLMLMMLVKHLHFHVIPRYSSIKTFANTEWKDEGWPKAPNMGTFISDANAVKKIYEVLKKA